MGLVRTNPLISFRNGIKGRFDTGIWIAAVIRLLTSASFSICLPFLALYLNQERGMPMTLVGMVFLAGGICSAATQIVGGMLADRLGRRKLLIGATGISMLLYLVLAVLIGISAPILPIVLAYIAGRSMLMTIRPVVAAVIADLSKTERLTEGYGLLHLGGNVGFAAGPVLGGYMLTVLSYAWLFGAAAFIGLITFIIIFIFLRESSHIPAEHINLKSTLTVASDRSFLIFTILSLLVFLNMGQLTSTLSVFTVEHLGFTTAEYGLLLTINGLLIVVFQYPIARGINHLPHYKGLILGSLLYASGYLCFGWLVGFNWAVIAITVITAGEMVFTPLTMAVVAESSSADWRGRYMGFFGLSQTIGLSLAPLLGGSLIDEYQGKPMIIWGMISFVSFLAAIGFHRWGKQNK